MTPAAGTAAARYSALSADREPFLKRAREAAALTIPYLMPPSGFGTNSQLPTPYQSLGARGVRTLSSKLLLGLFPANTPFFKYQIDDLSLRKLEEATQQEPGLRGAVEEGLSARERATLTEMEVGLLRNAGFTAIQHLLTAGNFLVYVPPREGPVRGFRLDQFVVSRDPAGTVLLIIVKEGIDPQLAPDIPGEAAAPTEPASHGRDLDLYTVIQRNTVLDRWDIWQEIKGHEVPGSRGWYPINLCPWVPLRLTTQPGEDYGRSYVEEYLGHLDSLEGLTQAIVEGSAASARVVFMVKPNGMTQLRVITKARNGDTVVGNPDDVGTLQVQKSTDLSVAKQQAESIATDLAYAFLLNTAIQRNGERVTAEEIRTMAAELDQALGGVYTLLSAEFQLPIVRLFEKRMEQNKRVPPLPKDMVKPVIVTGIEAIGRGVDQRNLKLFVADIIQIVGPEVAARYIKFGELIKRSAASYGIDLAGLIKSDEEIAAEEQAAQQAQMIEQLGPNAINQLGGMAQAAMKQGAGPAAPPQEQS